MSFRQTRTQLEQARVNLEQLEELRNLIANKAIRSNGVRAKELRDGEPAQSGTDIAYMWGIGYRSDMSIAAEVWLKNPGSEPWTAVGGSLVDARGRELRGMKIRQDNPIAPNTEGPVIVEATVEWGESLGELTLTLRDEGSRGITIPGLTFP
ncbi:DUF2381 family protein [Archangium gephyra]|uniref:DUF2381 family protein n=1 Tax=Archangium gephyra TaxID=48 RepID=UPI003B7BA378